MYISYVWLTQSIPAHYRQTRGDDCAHTVLKHVEKVEYSRDGPPPLLLYDRVELATRDA